MGRWVLSHHGFGPAGGEAGRGGGGALGRMELAWEAKAALGLGACDWRRGLALAAGSWAGDAGPWSFGPCWEEARRSSPSIPMGSQEARAAAPEVNGEAAAAACRRGGAEEAPEVRIRTGSVRFRPRW